jgi:MFS family permease
MLAHPLYKLIHFRKDTPDGIAAIYINTALRTFAVSLVGIFVPVFLFLKAQGVWGKDISFGIYGVILYFAIKRFSVIMFLIPAAKIISKLGFRWSIFSANLLLVVLLALLSLTQINFWIIPLAAVVNGFQGPLYWLSYKTLFAREGVLSSLGREVGLSAISTQIAAIAGPVLGGVIITVWGFSAMFIVALIVVVISGIPFFFMPHHEHKYTASLIGVVEWLKNRKHWNEELSFLGRHINASIYGLFWPIYVFLVLDSFEKQGLAASLALVASAAMVYVAGRMFDRKHSKKAFNFGILLTSLAWIARGFVRSLNQLVAVETSANAISPFYWVTFDSLVYERAREKDEKVIVFMVGRELVVSIAVLIVLVVALIVAKYEWRFWALWMMALVSTLSTFFMWEGGNEK